MARIRFIRSAYRHGISEDRALNVVQNCPWPAYSADALPESGKVLYLWADQHGIPIEVVAVEYENGDLVVIHAMKMRRRYQDYYTMLLRWQRP